MSVSGPIRNTAQFNEVIEELTEKAEQGGMSKSQIAALTAQQITVLGSQMMRNRSGLEFGAAKSIREMSQAIGDLARRL